MKTSHTVNPNHRWGLVNKNTFKVRRTFATRAVARENKRRNERIFDIVTGDFVR
jgi:hypothetical protein